METQTSGAAGHDGYFPLEGEEGGEVIELNIGFGHTGRRGGGGRRMFRVWWLAGGWTVNCQLALEVHVKLERDDGREILSLNQVAGIRIKRCNTDLTSRGEKTIPRMK